MGIFGLEDDEVLLGQNPDGPGYRAQMRAFVDAALSGAAPPVTAADGCAAVQVARAANKSWLEATPVELEHVNV